MVNKTTIGRSDLATKCGVTRAAITKACKGPLLAAISGDRLDAKHPDVVNYIEKKLKAQTLKAGKQTKKKATEAATKKKSQAAKRKKTLEATKAKKAAASTKKAANGPEDPPDAGRTEAVGEEVARIQSYFYEDIEVEPLLAMSLREIVNQFGSGAQFKDYTAARKTLEEIRMRKLKNQQTEGLLIPRGLVSKIIFSAIENSHLRLLQDSPRTITARVVALIKSGGTSEECELLVRGLISTQLKGVKAAAQRLLKDG